MTNDMLDMTRRAVLALLVYVGLAVACTTVEFRPTPSYGEAMWDWCRSGAGKRTHHEHYVCIEALGKRP